MTEYGKYFLTKSKGGYSNCLDRGHGNCLPNCVGWAWGNFYFFHGQRKDIQTRPLGNANMIYELCKREHSGFIVSKALKENSIICFGCGQYGHVMYCHFKMPNGMYLCSESNYDGNASRNTFNRFFVTANPQNLYKNYQGCVYDFYDDRK